MKKILFVFILLFAFTLYAQQQIVYNSSPTLVWNFDNVDSQGNPLLPEDSVSFEIYIFDTANGDVKSQPIESLIPFTVSSNTEVTLNFPYRANWAVALRSVVTDGAGNQDFSEFSYSISEIPETLNGPFVYAPNLTGSPAKPHSLRDSGM